MHRVERDGIGEVVASDEVFCTFVMDLNPSISLRISNWIFRLHVFFLDSWPIDCAPRDL